MTEYRCTLTRDEAADRIDDDRALADRVVSTERLDDGVRIAFTPGADTRELVDTFVTNEQGCCSFFTFDVTESGEAVTLTMTAPDADDAQQLVDAARQTFELGPDTALPLAHWEDADA